jgi:catechol 2,3-dioxygenase-like lactoylglutathione lyase family enzyme
MSPLAIEAFDHVVVVVRDIDRTLPAYEAVFGPPIARLGGREVGYHRAVFGIGASGARIELCQPLASDEPGGDTQASRAFRRRLDGQGEGVHNVAFRVRDVAAARTEAGAHDIATIESEHSDTIFLHPATHAGALIQLVGEPL